MSFIINLWTSFELYVKILHSEPSKNFLIINVYIKFSVNFRQRIILAERLDRYQVIHCLGINTSISNDSFTRDQTLCTMVIQQTSKKVCSSIKWEKVDYAKRTGEKRAPVSSSGVCSDQQQERVYPEVKDTETLSTSSLLRIPCKPAHSIVWTAGI